MRTASGRTYGALYTLDREERGMDGEALALLASRSESRRDRTESIMTGWEIVLTMVIW